MLRGMTTTRAPRHRSADRVRAVDRAGARRVDPRDLSAVPAVAARQAGAFTRQQARAEGWSPAQVKQRVRSGRWVRVAGRALVAASARPDPWTAVWAVRLTWPDAVASHLTAARALGLPVPAGGPEHATGACGVRSLRDLVVHRVDLPADDVRRTGRDEPAVTTLRRTVLDCLRVLPVDDADRLLAWCLPRGVLRREDLRAAVLAGFGRLGTPALLGALRRTAGDALSPAERRMHALLRRGGVRGWTANATVRDAAGVVGVVDVLFARQRVVIEVDGWAAHGGREAFESDRRRQNRLTNAGYRVLRFTWRDLDDRPDAVLAEVRAALRGTGDRGV
jgi:very-short-patch-repair endonuclease